MFAKVIRPSGEKSGRRDGQTEQKTRYEVRSPQTAGPRWWSRVDRWLSASLGRWLTAPIAVMTAVIALAAVVIGCVLPEHMANQTQADSLTSAARATCGALEAEIADVASSVARLAQNDQFKSALGSGNLARIRSESVALSQVLGIDVLALATHESAAGSGQSDIAKLDLLHGPDLALLQNLGIGTAAPRIALPEAAGQPSVIALTRSTRGPSFVIAQPVLVGGAPRQWLVAGASLSPLISPLASEGRLVVLYDTDARPISVAGLAATASLEDMPSLDQVSSQGAGPQRLVEIEWRERRYASVSQPVASAGRTIGHVAIWQPAGGMRTTVRVWQGLWVILVASSAVLVLRSSVRLTRRVTVPVTDLISAARTAATEGQTLNYNPASRVRELELLAAAFNEMSGHVQRQTGALQEKARQFDYLFEASAELGRSLHLEESLGTAAEALYGLGGVSYVVVFTGHGELGPYTCRAARGLPQETISSIVNRDYAVPLWGVMARALVGRQALVIDDVAAQNRPRAGEFDWDIGTGSMLLFPIVGADEPTGLIIIGARETGVFGSANPNDLVFALARIAAQSIQNAQLYQEAVRSQEQLINLQVISKLVASVSQMDMLLDVVVREAGDIVGESQAWLFLRDPVTGANRLYGQTRSQDGELWTPVHQDAVTWVMKAGQPIFYDPEHSLAQSPILAHSGPAMCVPLEVNDDTIGALVVVSLNRRRNYVEEDMVVLRTLTNAAAVALRTAQLTQRFQSDYLDLVRVWAMRSDISIWGQPGHTSRVAANVLALAKATGLSPSLHMPLELAAYLHDVAVQSAQEEVEARDLDGIEPEHALAGADCLLHAGVDSRVVTLVRHHHSARPDVALGDGDLGMAAAALALANLFDAWLVGEPNHPPLTACDIEARLRGDNGRTFSPGLVAELMKLWRSGQLMVP